MVIWRRRAWRRALALLAGLVAIAAAVSLVPGSNRAAGDSAPGLPAAEPDLSLPAIPGSVGGSSGSSFLMLGADASGEAFAYTIERSNSLALARVGANQVPSDWSGRRFVIYARDAGGWHISQEALDQNGAPTRTDFQPAGYGSPTVPAGAVAPDGTAAIAGTTGGGQQQMVLVRPPGGQFREAQPPSPQQLPVGDQLFTQSAPALAPFGEDGRSGVLVAPVSSSQQSTRFILHYDGRIWTQEPIEMPGVAIQSVLAISATSTGTAYLLAQTSNTAAGIQLFKRDTSTSRAQWVPVHLDGETGALYATSSGSRYRGLAPLNPTTTTNTGAQPLTATTDGAWVDGTFHDDTTNTSQPFTVHLTVTEQSDGPHATLNAWCNVSTPGLCDPNHTLPYSLPSQAYRSFAWPGGGPDGTRIVTGLPDGAILSLQGANFVRIAGLGSNPNATQDGSAAFLSPTEGWTGGAPPIHFTVNRATDPLQGWPTPFRQPLTAIASEPGHTPGSIAAKAIAVGSGGEVARYTPGQGWAAESLLTAAGVAATPQLRAVAWPTEEFAYAVGDDGAMWRWDSVTGLWARDPATPPNFNGNLTGIAFDPNNPNRGYAVGLDGVLLGYSKTWTQEPLPPGLQNADFTSITFAGSEAIAAFQLAQPRDQNNQPYKSWPAPDSGLLVNNGDGWQVDAQEQQITQPPLPSGDTAATRPVVNVVGGLPDGGAVAAGYGVLLERDSAGAPWRLARDPLPGYSVVAAAAIRDGPLVRALLSVDPGEPNGQPWPKLLPTLPPACSVTNSCTGDQGLRTLPTPYDLPVDGWLVLETANGWQDIQHNDYPADYPTTSGPADNPRRDDPIQALLISPDGSQGWAVGGETGIAMTGGPSSSQDAIPLHTAGIYRYPASSSPPTGASVSPPATDPRLLTVAFGGEGACQAGCGDRDPIVGLGPPTWVDHAVSSVSALSAQPGGPRAFVYTGGVVPNALQSAQPDDPSVSAEIAYFQSHAQAAAGGLPFAPVVSPSEVLHDTIAPAFLQHWTPPTGIRGMFPDYYAFDVSQAGGIGRLRIIVIDDASPSAAQDLVNPSSSQSQFLTGELADARATHVPAIVVGSRTLTTASVTGDVPPPNASAIAALLVRDGASAYFFESPASNTQYTIPAGAGPTSSIPSYGTGSLSYAAWTNAGNHFGESGYLLASIDPTKVDPTTNRVPVTVRLIPNISGLAVDATAGTFLLRSQVALFDALARRPLGGSGDSGVGTLVGPDPYITIPPPPCTFECGARINPEFSFTSSRPDIANFVEHDPASPNPLAVYLGPNGKPVADSGSGLLCAYNEGTTIVTVTTGGLTFSEPVTVQGGQVKQPCGTVPLSHPPPLIKVQNPSGVTPPATVAPTVAPTAPLPVPPPPPAAPAPPPAVAPPPTAVAAAVVPPPPAPPPVPSRPPSPSPPSLPPALVPPPAPLPGLPPVLLAAPLPPPPPAPTGFSGVSVLVTQPVPAAQEERKEEHATEEAQQFSAYHPDERLPISPELAVALAVILAGAGVSLWRGRPRRREAPALALAPEGDWTRRSLRHGRPRWPR